MRVTAAEATEVRMSAYAWTVGVDWGGAQHHVTVLDSAGAVRGTRIVAHAAAAIAEAVHWFRQVTGAGTGRHRRRD